MAVEQLKGHKAGTAATFEWSDSPAAPSYHLNSVSEAIDLADPRRPPGRGAAECETDAPVTTCTDPDALDRTEPLIFYRVLAACGPSGRDEGPR